jgi:NAD+ synthase
LQVVAATSFKQRVRKMLEYYHADRLHHAVAGTPNRLEYDQGFFVKNGDGAADVKPIAHLYKTQVYQLADLLGIPDEIRERAPTTDTYSLPQTQEEFFFSLPYGQMDACLLARDHGVPPPLVAEALGLTPDQVARVYRDIDAKRAAARYLHAPALLIDPPGIPGGWGP